MKATTTKFISVFLLIAGFYALPIQAQQVDEKEDSETKISFVYKGNILAGFSVGFINASRGSYNHEFEREFSRLSINFDGLYFLSDHVGVGPIVGYEFVYRDLVPTPPAPPGDIDVRRSNFRFGGKVGWYTSAQKLFNIPELEKTLFFVDGGISWLRTRYRQERFGNAGQADYSFNYQIGTGLLIPLGKQIALNTRLGFQANREEYRWIKVDPNDNKQNMHKTVWQKEVTLSFGLKVSF